MKKVNRERHGSKRGITAVVFCSIILLIALLAFFSANWYIHTYGKTGFDSVLYTLLSDFDGVEMDLIKAYLMGALGPALLTFFFAAPMMAFLYKKNLMRRSMMILCCILCSAGMLYYAADISQLLGYLQDATRESAIYETSYQDPKETDIIFPAKKRNLIYIFMESMENTYFSTEQGGMLATCTIPELYQLAEDNVSFSCNNDVGGLYAGPGGTWTIGAMVSHTAGVPLRFFLEDGRVACGRKDAFLPGVTSLPDILHENGYDQTLMVGSDSAYGSRKDYFGQHGIDHVYDLYTAREDGIVPENYRVWWGMEDFHLYEYAERELAEISAENQPFAFYMLTVDTHHIGGYVCQYCRDTHEKQYENVQSCASRQLADFLQWAKKQDFYEDTTIVIVGDHPSMDQSYMDAIGAGDFERCVYNCFVNAAVEPVRDRERTAFTLDLFPTTLAAMGCTISGDRLGLGTNLFSATPALGESLGRNAFCDDLRKKSSFYTKNFF